MLILGFLPISKIVCVELATESSKLTILNSAIPEFTTYIPLELTTFSILYLLEEFGFCISSPTFKMPSCTGT